MTQLSLDIREAAAWLCSFLMGAWRSMSNNFKIPALTITRVIACALAVSAAIITLYAVLNLLFGVVRPLQSYLLFAILSAGFLIVAGVALSSFVHRQRKETEHLQARLQAVEQRELERLGSHADASNEAIAIVQSATVVHCNSLMCELSGLQPEEFDFEQLTQLLKIEIPELEGAAVDAIKHQYRDGVLTSRQGRQIPVEVQFREIEIRAEHALVVVMRDASEKLETESAMHHMAMHDGLTGLPNRRQFMESLDAGIEQSLANGKQLAVMYIDLDHFKFVNDTYGHALGDALLQEVSAVIDRAKHPTDVGARLGGDEFAVLMIEQNRSISDDAIEDQGAEFNPQRLADSILEGVAGCKTKLGISGKFGASVGYSVLHDGSDEAVPEKAELLSRADLALYHVKETGKNAAVGYSAEIGHANKQLQQWVAALPAALDNDELTLQFQPQAVCESRELVGFEALVRWQSSDYGAVPPESILQAAEMAGKVSDLTAWIVRNACSNLAQWPGELRMAINLSANELTNYWLCGHIAEELQKNNLDPSRLEIEITETVLIQDEERTRVALEQLSELGVTIALDDFGTGYSSLSMLVQYPINRIKIDRSFVSRVEITSDKALISSTLIELAHGLGIRVLAEGVELESDANRLVMQNCDEFQGYLVGKPLPADEVALFVEKHVESNQKIRLIASQDSLRKAG